MNNCPMLNAYPDSIGGKLSDIVEFLEKAELKDVFQSFYILPSLYHTDLDRGFSVIDYSLNKLLAKKEDLERIDKLGMDLKLDFVLNHMSVLSPQFQDLIANGKNSEYRDFFINWNEFWKDHGIMTLDGYIQPDQELIKDMFFRKPGLPILMVRMPDGSNVPYWNTFYQEVQYQVPEVQELMRSIGLQYQQAVEIEHILQLQLKDGKALSQIDYDQYEFCKEAVIDLLESKRMYLGQMDLNVKSPLVWEFYENTLKKLSEYGAKIVRLDAFAYASKEPGLRNFLNEPETWDILEKVQEIANRYHLTLLPEIHASYEEKTYEQLAKKGYMSYDFFLPGLIIDALESHSGERVEVWAKELYNNKIRVVNMLGCHDGIPLLDLKGLIPEEQILNLIDTVVSRGGFVKNLHGQKNVYYQVNATYYSALGEDDQKMLLARALQLFMPGKPQVWYLDLFAGKNDHEAVALAGPGGHKEINRTNLSQEYIREQLKHRVVQKQLEMLRFRNTFKAFGFDAEMEIEHKDSQITICWKKENCRATLSADLLTSQFKITGEENGNCVYEL